MRKKLAQIALVGLVAAAAPMATAASPAHAAVGVATAGTPGYDVGMWAKAWACSYAGWSGGTKAWSCDLTTLNSLKLVDRDGTFTGSGLTTSTFYYRSSNSPYCVAAYAAFLSGGSGADSDRTCA